MGDPVISPHDTPPDARPDRPAAAARPAFRFGSVGARWVARVAGILVCLTALAGGALAVRHKKPGGQDPRAPAPGTVAGVEVVGPDTIRVSPGVLWSLGVQTAEVKAADQPRPLPPLQGTLNIDYNRMVRIHSPFAGVVAALGTPDGGETDRPAGDPGPRGLRAGDKVRADQLLAVVWSKELGEKKNELVQAMSDLKLARDQLARYQSLTEGIIAQKEVRAAEAAVRSAENAVGKAEATLRAWRLPEAQIRELMALAEKVGTPEARRELTAARSWARVEVRAPFAGTLLEKNTNVGDVVDTSADLFRVVDLSRLAVVAQVYEDDLPALQAMPLPIRWEVRVPSRPDFKAAGALEQIGDVIDPAQHTVLATGTVDNPRGELKSGQFVTATVAVPAPAGEVEVPSAALVEDGKTSVVFVQPDPDVPEFVRRSVAVTRRYHDMAYVKDGVRPGERVVTGGALQLNQALVDAAPGVVARK